MAGRFNFVLTKAFFAGVCGQYGEKNNAGQDKVGRPGAEMLNLNTLLLDVEKLLEQEALAHFRRRINGLALARRLGLGRCVFGFLFFEVLHGVGDDLVQLAAVEPDAAALPAVVYLNALTAGWGERFFTNRTQHDFVFW
jgi:hypothetical protein